jgi:Zn-dependent protease with chaperone function
MAVALALIVASFYGLSHALAAVVVSNLSLSDERRYFSGFDDGISEGAKPFPLEAMAYRPNLPEGVGLFVADRSEANAYATLGGSVFVTRGLLENVENEETLAFVIGHEIGHIVARDPIRRLASDMPFSISLAFVASSL